MARHLGISAAHLCDLEAARRLPSPALLAKIVQAYQEEPTFAGIIAAQAEQERTERWFKARFPAIDPETRRTFVVQILRTNQAAQKNKS